MAENTQGLGISTVETCGPLTQATWQAILKDYREFTAATKKLESNLDKAMEQYQDARDRIQRLVDGFNKAGWTGQAIMRSGTLYAGLIGLVTTGPLAGGIVIATKVGLALVFEPTGFGHEVPHLAADTAAVAGHPVADYAAEHATQFLSQHTAEEFVEFVEHHGGKVFKGAEGALLIKDAYRFTTTPLSDVIPNFNMYDSMDEHMLENLEERMDHFISHDRANAYLFGPSETQYQNVDQAKKNVKADFDDLKQKKKNLEKAHDEYMAYLDAHKGAVCKAK